MWKPTNEAMNTMTVLANIEALRKPKPVTADASPRSCGGITSTR
jgi:hypothetical protein